MSQQNDDLAYGHYSDSSRGFSDTSRGLSDTFKKFYKGHQSSSQPGQPAQPYNQTYNQSGSQGTHQDQNQPPQYGSSSQTPNPPYQQHQQHQYQGQPQKQDKLSGFLGKIQGTVTEYGSEWASKIGNTIDPQAYAQYGHTNPTTEHRFGSFAPPREHNDVKWYVDGASYFWAVSRALENARESIWILDWWLSPELYLRRPPTKNENYRLDRMLQAAAQRGVRVNIIVYKEVTQALTLSSSHTKKALESLHPNIAVFRHPDHLPDGHEVASEIANAFQHLTLDSASLTRMNKENLKGVYGATDEMILYWAHHEKLCLIDGHIAFMGGLDLCFGRWDTNQHAIADVHPEDLNETVFPGQDYNNSRVLDFHNVAQWESNQLDRRVSSRMGWSDISISLHGAAVEDLRRHFVERWNFIYDAKYQSKNDSRYARLALYGRPTSSSGQHQGGQQQSNLYPSGQASPQVQQPSQQYPAQTGGAPTFPPPPNSQGQQSQQNQPSWQAGSTHPSAVQSSVSPQPQQLSQQQQQPQQQQQATTPSYQQYQPATYPPNPSQTPQNPGQGQQQQNSQSWQSGKTDYPPQGQSQTPSNTQPPPPAYSSNAPQDHGSAQYSYTGDSFPPPPPGPAPSQSPANTPYHPQQQGQASYYPPATSNVSELPAQSADNYAPHGQSQSQPSYYPPQNQASGTQSQTQAQAPYYSGQESHSATRGFDEQHHDSERGFVPQHYQDKYSQYTNSQHSDGERGFVPKRYEEKFNKYVNPLRGQLAGQIHQYQDRLTGYGRPASQSQGHMSCQVVRSCTKWSNGSPLEHSIANAYAAVIKNSLHFVYIENQFFITATGGHQHPVKNTIGAAIVERILRAARAGEKYKIIVVIPSIPCFAGDLHDDETLGTRAIMEFQYNSINRGGNSIMELIAKEGYNPMEYIRFYNLRNYDRINNGNAMAAAEHQSGVNYGDASHQYDQHASAPINYGQQSTPAPTNYGQQSPASTDYGQHSTPAPTNYGQQSPASTNYGQQSTPAPTNYGQQSSPAPTNYGQQNSPSPVNYGQQSAPAPANYGQHNASSPVNYGQQSAPAPVSAPRSVFDPTAPFQKYQHAAQQDPGNKAPGAGRWDSVSSCYMLGGEDIRNVPWNGHPDAEIDAFVSEELYVHSKVMIADDRVVICGSANLNDRSQLGEHDSEIALVIEDFTPIQSTMNGRPWTASRFASSLRRQLMRKHLGLVPPQDYQRPDANFEPVGVPQQFDFDCPESKIVSDPLSEPLQSLWNSRAHTNTDVFRKVFHAVPDDNVRNWSTYKEFYEYYFHGADREAEGKGEFGRPARYQWGHVVRDNFPPGPDGAKQVKELLSQVKGTLVEMPLMFLGEEDIAKTGLTLNELTEPIYT
ncbi:Phospholipase D/Transphosphatidylase [Penicillium pulvis]|uniref:Phospholipase D/Transphosphatidylase n=1 Tax=Penicillium pulvis TaxID=1562058 RepID=UPI0025473652|nr:Phospholipase D/Transphosphatidylase [Penicillium pulvis]KAJ5785509.1 Phospholipase D/Transphosphatidylase [Penicillium pulvis]